MFVLLTVVITLIATGYLYYKKNLARTMELVNTLPGPPSIPLLGHTHHLIGKSPEQMFQTMKGWTEKYGDTFKIWLGPQLNLIMSNLKDIEVILTDSKFNDKSIQYKFMDPWLKEGLLVSKGRKWFKRRKVITPAFHFKILETYIDIFDKQFANFNKSLEKMCKEGKPFELYELINLYTLDVICETAMGVQIDAQTNSDSKYVKAVKTISMVLHKRMFDFRYTLDFFYQFTNLAREEKKALQVLHGFSKRIIEERREELLKKGNRSEQVDEFGQKKKQAFLDILLQSEIDGKPLSNLDIREEVDTFIFEGHDTTSSAIMFFFFCLGLTPEAEKKCFDEIYEIYGKDKSTPVRHEDLSKLHYVELCIKETLRMFPSVPIMGRKVNEECEINGKVIPAEACLAFSPLQLGWSDEIFPEARTFKPERHDVVTSSERLNPFAYIPFSAGPRNCIGQKFAMSEIKSVVTNIMRNYKVEYVGEPDIEGILIAELILRTRDPLMFKVTPRVY